MKTLEFATDLLAMTGASEVERHPDRVVQRTPSEPDFWFGNRVIFTDPPRDAGAALAQFHADFPDAGHVCIGWDMPNLPVETVNALFKGTDLAVEQCDALTLSGPLRDAPPPKGLTLRRFAAEDWQQSHEIALEIAMEEGVPLERHRAFLEGRAATRQSQIAESFAQRVGAFESGLLVGDMGVVWNASYIRYQDVQTRKSHRGRGIASALLGYALRVAREHAPDALPVIVADAESAAGRLYRRAGFALAETSVSASRPWK